MNDGAAATETRREVATLAILINTNATRAVRMPLGVNQSRAFLATVVLTCPVCALAHESGRVAGPRGRLDLRTSRLVTVKIFYWSGTVFRETNSHEGTWTRRTFLNFCTSPFNYKACTSEFGQPLDLFARAHRRRQEQHAVLASRVYFPTGSNPYRRKALSSLERT